MLHSPYRSWLAAGCLVAITFAAYHHAVACEWIWDDDSYVTKNTVLTEPGGLQRIWTDPSATPQYYPLVFTSFWIEHQLWGLRPAGYHVTNIAIHALVVLLWWRLLRRLAVPGAWVAAAVFALHPVHVESVAWVTERKNVLSGVFYVAALLAWMRFSPPEDDRPNTQRNWAAYVSVLLLFLCALLSKSVTATLPAAIALGIWWKRGGIGKRDVMALAPLLVLGIAFGLHTAHLEVNKVGAQGAAWDLTFADRLLVAGRVLWFYAGKLAWPAELIFIYPRWTIDTGDLVQWIYPAAALLIMTVLVIGHRRFGRGAATGILFFAGTLFPALGFLDVYPMQFSWVADHFQYLASMGLIALAAAAMTMLLRHVGKASVLVAAVVLIALGARTWSQTHWYDDEHTLWQRTLALNPDAYIAHHNIGTILHDQGNHDEAIASYHRSLQLYPDHGESHNNLAKIYMERGEVQKAVDHYQRAADSIPTYAPIQMSLAIALEKAGDLPSAIEHYEQALRLNPQFVEARQYLAAAHITAAMASASVGQATEHFVRAVQLRPDDLSLRYNLALSLANLGQPGLAVEHLRAALQIDPTSPQVLDLLSQIHAQRGDMAKAIQLATRALQAAQHRGDEKLAASIAQKLKIYQDASKPP